MAEISAVRIANFALSHVGGRSVIESFAEQSAEAQQTDLWYDYSRLQVLEAFDWSFARKTQVLALHSDAAPENRWGFRYAYPSDAIVMRLIENPLGKLADAVPFAIEMSLDGTVRTIVTNMEDACAIYTMDIEDPGLFSPHFVETVAVRLAAHIAFSMTGQREVKGDMVNLYRSLLQEAPAYNANEEVMEPPREAEVIRARGATSRIPDAKIDRST